MSAGKGIDMRAGGGDDRNAPLCGAMQDPLGIPVFLRFIDDDLADLTHAAHDGGLDGDVSFKQIIFHRHLISGPL